MVLPEGVVLRRWSYLREGAVLPEGAAQRGEHGIGGHVVGLDEGPVVGGEGPGQRHLAQRRHEVGAPEEEEDVVELQADQVLVVRRLPAVERKQALRVRAVRLHGAGGEVLVEKTQGQDQEVDQGGPQPYACNITLITYKYTIYDVYNTSLYLMHRNTCTHNNVYNTITHGGFTVLPGVHAVGLVEHLVDGLVGGGQETG